MLRRVLSPWSVLLLVGMVLVGFDNAARADTIYRRSVKTPVNGTVKDISKTELTVEKKSGGGGTEKIPASDIVSITWSDEPPGLNIARINENNGAYDKALETYTKAVEQASKGPDGLQADLKWAVARCVARKSQGDSAKLDEAIKALETFKTGNGDHYTYFECVRMLGELYLEKKDFLKSRTQFEALGKATATDSQMASKIALGRIAQAEGKGDDAIASYDAVIAMTAANPSEEAQRLDASLRKGTILLTKSQTDEAVKLLDEVIEKSAADDTRIQAEAWVRKGDALRSKNSDLEALLAYLHVEVLFSAEKSQHAEALFQLHKLAAKLGQPARAAEFREKLEADYPNSDWTKQLKTAG